MKSSIGKRTSAIVELVDLYVTALFEHMTRLCFPNSMVRQCFYEGEVKVLDISSQCTHDCRLVNSTLLLDRYKTLADLSGVGLGHVQSDVQGISLASLFKNPEAPSPGSRVAYSQIARAACTTYQCWAPTSCKTAWNNSWYVLLYRTRRVPIFESTYHSKLPSDATLKTRWVVVVSTFHRFPCHMHYFTRARNKTLTTMRCDVADLPMQCIVLQLQ
jgi:hypothetical protein